MSLIVAVVDYLQALSLPAPSKQAIKAYNDHHKDIPRPFSKHQKTHDRLEALLNKKLDLKKLLSEPSRKEDRPKKKKAKLFILSDVKRINGRLPETDIWGEEPRTHLTDREVDTIARHVLTESRRDRCQRTGEYCDTELKSCNESGGDCGLSKADASTLNSLMQNEVNT